MSDDALKGYDEWKCDYPAHWDEQTFDCDCCSCTNYLEAGIEVGRRMVCPSCYDEIIKEMEDETE